MFQSPALNALVQRAFKANPTIASAQAALAQAQELVYAQQGYFFPTIGANYNFERQKIAGNLTLDNAPGVEGNGDNLLPPVQDRPSTRTPSHFSTPRTPPTSRGIRSRCVRR